MAPPSLVHTAKRLNLTGEDIATTVKASLFSLCPCHAEARQPQETPSTESATVLGVRLIVEVASTVCVAPRGWETRGNRCCQRVCPSCRNVRPRKPAVGRAMRPPFASPCDRGLRLGRATTGMGGGLTKNVPRSTLPCLLYWPCCPVSLPLATPCWGASWASRPRSRCICSAREPEDGRLIVSPFWAGVLQHLPSQLRSTPSGGLSRHVSGSVQLKYPVPRTG